MSLMRAFWVLSAAVSITAALGGGACSSSGAGGASSGVYDASTDGMTGGGCTSDSDCTSHLPPTTPPNCATGTCNTVEGVCVFAAKDQDGDGHAAANCKSTNGGAVQDGDDCNDHDPNLYPGHPETCHSLPDGGSPVGNICTLGELTCQPDGTESPCTGLLACTGGCVGSRCTDCVPGSAQCVANGVENCTASGAWGGATACMNSTCVQTGGVSSGDAGSVGPSASCEGVCVSGATTCNGTQPQKCSSVGQWQNSAPCSAGQVCNGGSCESGCYIGGAFYAAGATNLNDTCQMCDPTSSTSVWSNVMNGTGCGNGQVCSNGACGTQCDIGGTIYLTGTPNPANACQTCQPGRSTTSWTSLTLGTSCGSGELCTASSCAPGCFISGMVYSSGAANPANACQSCQPSGTTTSWSADPDGTSCGSGAICHANSCVTGCFIGGIFFPSGANPSNPCQTCDPTASTSAWTTVSLGTACGTGEVCDGTNCTSGCFINGAVYAANAANPARVCESCQPGVSTTMWSSESGPTCGTGGTCNGGKCVVPFGYTGAAQAFVVPAGITTLTVEAYGAAGGCPTCSPNTGGGLGGSVTATIQVTSGESIGIYVGGQDKNTSSQYGGFNGGASFGGGGASDVRQGGGALGNRIVVAGGGGGDGACANGGTGGAGGGAADASGTCSCTTNPTACPGGGGGAGTLTGGGAAGAGGCDFCGCGGGGSGADGTLGMGGWANACGGCPGGGGGGGYYGGGGGGGGDCLGGGGGGSSYAVALATGVMMVQGVQAGAGRVVITY